MNSIRVSIALLAMPESELAVLLLRGPGAVWSMPEAALDADAGLAGTAEGALRSGAGVTGVPLEQLYTLDSERPDAAVQVAYMGLTRVERHALAPGEGVVQARWFTVSDLPALAPDTDATVRLARTRVRAKAAYSPIVMSLLPAAFTLGDLQAAYEGVLGASLDTRNFRRDAVAGGIVEDTGRTRAEGPGRPARLFRARPGSFAVDAGERRALRALASARRAPESNDENGA